MSAFDVRLDGVKEFDRNTNRFIKKYRGKFSQKIRRIAMMVLQGVVERSLVDTGLSRNNWQVNVGSLTSDIIEGATDPVTNGSAALSQLRNDGIGEVIFIYNNVEYVIYLEFGTEKMPPVAMLRDSLGAVAVALR